jgi:hypothetical protein
VIDNSGQIILVQKPVQTESISVIADIGSVTTRIHVGELVEILEACIAGIMEWGSRKVFQFNSVKMEAALFIRSWVDK